MITVAGEALISAYAHGFGFQAYIFRFVSILGERYTHGHVFDFYAKLLANPHGIEVLGVSPAHAEGPMAHLKQGPVPMIMLSDARQP